MAMSPELAAEYADEVAHAYEDRAPNLLASGIVTLVAAYVAVGIRLFSRRWGQVNVGKDDIFIAIALFWATAYTVPILVVTRYGFGRHTLLTDRPDLIVQGKAFLGILAVLPVAIFFIKISILLLYSRIFPVRGMRIALICTATFVACTEVANLFAQIFECIPVGAQMSGAPHHCVNQDAVFTSFSFINMALDFWILLMPAPLVWRLHTSSRRKMQISGVFLLGLLACIASVVRAAESLTTNYIDTTYDDASSQIWTMVELNLSIVSSCLLTFQPFFKFLKQKREQYSLRYLNSRQHSRTSGGKASRKTSASSLQEQQTVATKAPAAGTVDSVELGQITTVRGGIEGYAA